MDGLSARHRNRVAAPRVRLAVAAGVTERGGNDKYRMHIHKIGGQSPSSSPRAATGAWIEAGRACSGSPAGNGTRLKSFINQPVEVPRLPSRCLILGAAVWCQTDHTIRLRARAAEVLAPARGEGHGAADMKAAVEPLPE